MAKTWNLQLGGHSLPVISLEAKEQLDELSMVQVTVRSSVPLSIQCQQRVVLRFGFPQEKLWVGIVTQVITTDYQGKPQFELTLEPRLAQLRYQNKPKLWQQCSLATVVSDYLAEAGYEDQHIHFMGCCGDEFVSQWLQLPAETDWQAWQRLLSAYRLYFRLTTLQDKEHIILCAYDDMMPLHPISCIYYQPTHGLAASLDQVCGTELKIIAVPVNVVESIQGYDLAGTAAGFQLQVGSQPQYHEFNPHWTNIAAATQHLPNPSSADHQFELIIKTHEASWQVGHRIQLDSTLFDDSYNQTYYIKAIEHRGKMSATSFIYENELTLVPADRPIPAKNLPSPTLPLMLAKLVGNHREPFLDHHGDYAVMLPFFSKQQWITVKRTTLNASQQAGIHFPLPPKASVLVSWLYDSTAKPIIVAALPNHYQSSPVTAGNPHQGIIKTQGGHQWTFNQNDKPSMELSYGEQQLLYFTYQQHKAVIKLASSGAFQGNTDHSWQQQVGASWQQSSDKAATVVANNEIDVTVQGAVHHRIQEELNLLAQQGLLCYSQQQLSFNTKAHWQVKAKGNITWKTQQGDIKLSASKLFHFHSQENMTLSSEEAICLKIGSGSIQLLPTGEIQLIANHIHLKSEDTIQWQGSVDYV